MAEQTIDIAGLRAQIIDNARMAITKAQHLEHGINSTALYSGQDLVIVTEGGNEDKSNVTGHTGYSAAVHRDLVMIIQSASMDTPHDALQNLLEMSSRLVEHLEERLEQMKENQQVERDDTENDVWSVQGGSGAYNWTNLAALGDKKNAVGG